MHLYIGFGLCVVAMDLDYALISWIWTLYSYHGFELCIDSIDLEITYFFDLSYRGWGLFIRPLSQNRIKCVCVCVGGMEH